MTSKVQPTENHWINAIKMTSKCSPLQIIEPLTNKPGDKVVLFWWTEKQRVNGETPSRMGKYFEWIIKQLLNSAFVGYEEFCRSQMVLSTSAFAPPLWIKPSLICKNQRHSIIAEYLCLVRYTECVHTSKVVQLSSNQKERQKVKLGISWIIFSWIFLRWLPTVLTVSTPEKGWRTKNEVFASTLGLSSWHSQWRLATNLGFHFRSYEYIAACCHGNKHLQR